MIMNFYKSQSSEELTYQAAIERMQADGAKLISKKASHILAEQKDGRRVRYHFNTDSAMIAKADMSLAKAEEEAKTVLAATRKAEQAADVRKNEDDVEIDADSFNQLVKALQQRTQCSPHYARKCVISGLQNGTLTKMLGGYGAQLAMRQSQTNAQAQTEYRAAMAKVSQAPSGSRVNALRQAYIENPDAFA
jgi:hypothetical protein